MITKTISTNNYDNFISAILVRIMWEKCYKYAVVIRAKRMKYKKNVRKYNNILKRIEGDKAFLETGYFGVCEHVFCC